MVYKVVSEAARTPRPGYCCVYEPLADGRVRVRCSCGCDRTGIPTAAVDPGGAAVRLAAVDGRTLQALQRVRLVPHGGCCQQGSAPEAVVEETHLTAGDSLATLPAGDFTPSPTVGVAFDVCWAWCGGATDSWRIVGEGLVLTGLT